MKPRILRVHEPDDQVNLLSLSSGRLRLETQYSHLDI